MLSEFLFKLLNGIGPVDRFGSLVVIEDELIERGFEVIGAEKVIGLQMFALKHTEPNFDLIKPGRIGRQPEHLKVKVPFAGAFLLAKPTFELFGCVRRSIIQNESHRVDASSLRFGKNFLLKKGLEIDKTLAAAAGSVDLPVSHRKSGKQMACTTTIIARFVQHWLARTGWTRRLLSLTGLNGGFLIETDQPCPFLQERSRLGIGFQHRKRPLQEGDRIMDMLPSMLAPGAKAFGFEPATHRTGRDARKGGSLEHPSGKFGSTPPRERYLALLGEATRDGCDLRAYLRGKNASGLHCEAHRQADEC
jgi:hypothetical protein